MAVNILSSASKHNPEKNELVDALQDWDEKVFAEKKEKLFQEIQKL
ncbi:MAG: hypothetical protein LBO09_07385 [Candidatus Peribacteria bacterium]|jgi:hypothetical protein|nr:hypothetical protein [Candidatus Peribacteria bacterium]